MFCSFPVENAEQNENSIHWSSILIWNNKTESKKVKFALEGQPRVKAVFIFSFWNIFAFSYPKKLQKWFFKKLPLSSLVFFWEKKLV